MNPDERHEFTFDVTTADPASALGKIRRHLRGRGWARTRLLSMRVVPSAKLPGAKDLTIRIEGYGIRVASTSAGHATHQVMSGDINAYDPRSFKRGARVRTLAPGENFAHGRRRVMPPGTIGRVVSNDSTSVWVRAEDGRSYGYAPGDLERLPKVKVSS